MIKKGFIICAMVLTFIVPLKAVGAEKIPPPNLVDVKIDGVLVNLNNLKIDQEKTLLLEGTATPNSEVNIYIYSDSPMVAKSPVDGNGNWQYSLTQRLPVGEHKITLETHLNNEISSNVEVLKFNITRGTIPVVSQISDSALVGILILIVLALVIVWSVIKAKKK